MLSGFSLSAVLLLPGFEASVHSIYKLDNTALAGNIKYLSWKSVLTFFGPDIFGNPATANYWGDGSYDNSAFFIPAVGVMLFVVALVTRVAFKKENFIYVLLILGSLIFATKNSLSVMLSDFSLLGLNSAVNTRVLFITSFSSAILAAKMFDTFEKTKVKAFYKIVPLAIYIGIGAGFGIIYLQVRELGPVIHHLFNITPADQTELRKLLESADKDLSYWFGNLKVALRNLAIPLLIVVVGTIALHIKKKQVVFVILVLLIFISTKLSFDKYLSFTSLKLFYPDLPATLSLQEATRSHRFIHEKAELIPGNTWSAYLLRSPAGQNNLAALNTARYMSLVNQKTLDDGQLTRFIEVGNINSPLINTLDVETVMLLNRKPIESIPYQGGEPFPWLITPNFKELTNQGTVRMYQNQTNLGSAWFSRNVECLPALTDTVEILVRQNYDPQETMIINCNEGGLYDRPLGKASLINSTPNYLEYQVSTPEDNYLNISLSNYPGWQAYLDGRKVNIKSSNIALSGVFIPKGEHGLRLVYQPTSFIWGFSISAGTLIIWLMILVGLKFKVRSG